VTVQVDTALPFCIYPTPLSICHAPPPTAIAGPIGYCTEIFWDTQRPDEVPSRLQLYNCITVTLLQGLNEQWLEIWNIVLMSMLRSADGSTTPLPIPCVDTGACAREGGGAEQIVTDLWFSLLIGMGLERVCSVLQGAPTNYETDLLLPLIEQVRELHQQCRDISSPNPFTQQFHLQVKAMPPQVLGAHATISPGERDVAYKVRLSLHPPAKRYHAPSSAITRAPGHR
jgi:hypothetical protein